MQGLAGEALRKALMQPGRPLADVRQAGVRQLVGEDLPGGANRLPGIQNRNMDFTVIAAAAPSGRAGGFQVRFAALHDDGNPLIGAAA